MVLRHSAWHGFSLVPATLGIKTLIERRTSATDGAASVSTQENRK